MMKSFHRHEGELTVLIDKLYAIAFCDGLAEQRGRKRRFHFLVNRAPQWARAKRRIITQLHDLIYRGLIKIKVDPLLLHQIGEVIQIQKDDLAEIRRNEILEDDDL